MKLLSDEKELEEERETASQTKNRYKGTGSHGSGFGGSGGYGGESYDGVGSSGNYPKKKRDRDDGDRYGGYDSKKTKESTYSGSSSKYDPNPGQSNLMKKLGLQEKVEADVPKPKDDDSIDFPEENEASPPTPVTQTKPQAATLPQPTKKETGKFLPPPPAKGAGGTSGPATTKTTKPQTSTEPDLMDLNFLNPGESTTKPVIQQPTVNQNAGAGLNLIDFDLTGGPQVTNQQTFQTPQTNNSRTQYTNNTGNGYGNGTGFGYTQNTGSFPISNNGGAQLPPNGFGQQYGNQGYNQFGGNNQQTGAGMGGQFGGQSYGNLNAGLNGGFGASTTQPNNNTQAKKLITFDSKPSTNNEFSGFQEAKPKNPVSQVNQTLKNFSAAEADLIDLSGLTNEAGKSKKVDSNTINLGGW